MCRGMVWVSVLLGCESGEGELDSNSDLATLEASPLVRDLVRVHEEVFDQWVLFTLSEGDCEYPFLDGFGPEEIEIRSDAYPFPDIRGVLSMTVEVSLSPNG